MEGSGRMVIVGVGLNSQVGNIMSLLGATAQEIDSKTKKKDNKNTKTTTPSATKITPNLSKQSIHIEDETKPLTTTTEEHSRGHQLSSTKQSGDHNENKIKETNLNTKEEPTKNGQGGMAKLAEDSEEEEGSGSNDSKHKCK
jgi:hypothetical protein